MVFPKKLFFSAVVSLLLTACAGAPPSPQQAPDAQAYKPAQKSSHRASDLSIALSEAKRPLADMSGRIPGGRLLPPGTEKFLGLNGLDLQKVLGAPTFKRKDRQVEVWQYGKENCILDFFLYKIEDKFRVKHMEFRGRDVLKVDGDACLRHLLFGAT